MRSIFTRPHVRAIAAIVIGLFGIGALVAENPSVVRAATQLISNTCSSSATCYQWTNTGTGAAIRGAANAASGVVGATSATGGGKAGVYGTDLTNNGTITTNEGVHGLTNYGFGVVGDAKAFGIGVNGNSADASAVYGHSTGYIGVYAQSDANSFGVYAINDGKGTAVGAAANGSNPTIGVSNSGTGDGIDISISGTPGGPGQAIYGYNGASGGRGTDITGQYIGIIGRAPSGTGDFPLALTNSPYTTNLFAVDGDGNVFYHGSLSTFVRRPDGTSASAYGSKTTSPTVEDNGTGQLVNGSATVALDPTFASMMDLRTAYHVMLTPDGDTRGLYVASKTAHYFVVRETQGGHSTLSFDYHIYASEAGSAGMRSSVVRESLMGPRATMTHPLLPGTATVPSPRHQ